MQALHVVAAAPAPRGGEWADLSCFPPLSVLKISLSMPLSLFKKTKLKEKSRDLPAFCEHGCWWRIMVRLLMQGILGKVVWFFLPGSCYYNWIISCFFCWMWKWKRLSMLPKPKITCSECQYSLCQKKMLSEWATSCAATAEVVSLSLRTDTREHFFFVMPWQILVGGSLLKIYANSEF